MHNYVKISGIAGATVCFIASLYFDVDGTVRTLCLLLIGGLAGYELKGKT